MTARFPPLREGWLVPLILSTTAGAVDVTTFLALDGLFTAHITGIWRCRPVSPCSPSGPAS
jgi:hypothetical protein